MDSLGQRYNERCPGVKRLLREAIELAEATEEYCARPLEDNLFEWHFTVAGPKTTEFEGGVYHGRIILPQEYPMKPPDIVLLTPNGRFEVNKKICLSISGYHPETWRPSWSIRTALLALIAFLPSPAEGTIASLDYSPAERRVLARKSLGWSCPRCGSVKALLSDRAANPPTPEERTIIDQVALKGENENERMRSKTPQNNNSQEATLDTPSNVPDVTLPPPSEVVARPLVSSLPISSSPVKEDQIVWSFAFFVLCILVVIIYRRWRHIEAALYEYL